MNIKDNFHHLIDNINDEELLKVCHQLIEKIRDEQNGYLWNSLSEEQQKELLLVYEERLDEQNLLSHEAIKLQYPATGSSGTLEPKQMQASRYFL